MSGPTVNIVNGPNLGRLGRREPEVYGDTTHDDLVALLAAHGRSGALTEAERSAAAEQGREQRRRFLTPGSGYQAGSARMFNGN